MPTAEESIASSTVIISSKFTAPQKRVRLRPAAPRRSARERFSNLRRNGKKHIFGFEITWAIGDESHATETCLFYDGRVHKIGAVDVETFPKGRFLEEWKIISDDCRFNMPMKPIRNNPSDLTLGPIARMNCNQVYGKWNGNVVLDDGTVLEIKGMFAFCEYVENRW